jgi:hypothetical protein
VAHAERAALARAATGPTSGPQSTRRRLCGGGGPSSGAATKRVARASTQSAEAPPHAHVVNVPTSPRKMEASCRWRCMRCAGLRVWREWERGRQEAGQTYGSACRSASAAGRTCTAAPSSYSQPRMTSSSGLRPVSANTSKRGRCRPRRRPGRRARCAAPRWAGS